MKQKNGTSVDAVLVSDRVQEVFRNFLHNNDISVKTIDYTAGSTKGDNYLGIIAKAAVTGSDENGRPFEMSYIIKSAPKNEEFRALTHIREAYEREIYVYNQVLPELKKIQEDRRVTRPFASLAKCLMTSNEDREEVLIMTDMSALGYTLQDRKKSLDYRHVKLVIHELARLHAISFTLQDQRPELFREFSKLKTNIMLKIRSESFDQQIQKQCDRARDTLNPETDAKEIERFQAFSDAYFTQLTTILQDECAPYSAMRHGDCWSNNVLFAYGDPAQPKVPTSLCFLDWQLSHIASPVLDILYFIYACTDGNLRDNHLDELLTFYHDTMTEFAAEMGSDISRLYPYAVFMGQLQKYGRFGLYAAITLLPLLTSEPDEIPDVTDLHEDGDLKRAMEAFTSNSRDDDEYNTRVRDIIIDMVKRNFI